MTDFEKLKTVSASAYGLLRETKAFAAAMKKTDARNANAVSDAKAQRNAFMKRIFIFFDTLGRLAPTPKSNVIYRNLFDEVSKWMGEAQTNANAVPSARATGSSSGSSADDIPPTLRSPNANDRMPETKRETPNAKRMMQGAPRPRPGFTRPKRPGSREAEMLSEALAMLDDIPPTWRSPHENDRMPETKRETPNAKRLPPQSSRGGPGRPSGQGGSSGQGAPRSRMRPQAPRFESEFEADSMHGGQMKRQRQNAQARIAVDRKRTDRAQARAAQSGQSRELRRRAKQSALAKVRAVTPGAVSMAITRAVRPGALVQPGVLDRFRAFLNNSLLTTFGTLLADAGDGGGDLSATVFSAAIASAVARAAQACGITDEVDTPLVAKLLMGVYGASIGPELKVLATVIVLGGNAAAARRRRAAGGGLREFEMTL